jgi:hypothetical protein
MPIATTKALKGDERKAFMSTCLKKDVPQTQQDKMKTCNATPPPRRSRATNARRT